MTIHNVDESHKSKRPDSKAFLRSYLHTCLLSCVPYDSINKNAKQTKLMQAVRSQDSGYAGVGVTERKQEGHSWGVSDMGTGYLSVNTHQVEPF